MHSLMVSYKYLNIQKGALIFVVVLAVVHPPPVTVYRLVVDPAGHSRQGFFIRLCRRPRACPWMNAEKGNPFASADVREGKLNLRINPP